MSQSSLSENLLNRFIKYVKIDTMSDPHIVDQRPTTAGQLDLLRLLEQELHEIGVEDTVFDDQGYLVARIPGNLSQGKQVPVIGFMAHVDVADDVMGNSVKPRIITAY